MDRPVGCADFVDRRAPRSRACNIAESITKASNREMGETGILDVGPRLWPLVAVELLG
jgi:hypothetical protein